MPEPTNTPADEVPDDVDALPDPDEDGISEPERQRRIESRTRREQSNQ